MKRYFRNGEPITSYWFIYHSIRFHSTPKRSGTVYFGSKWHIQWDINILAPPWREPPAIEIIQRDAFISVLQTTFPNCQCIETICDNRAKEWEKKKEKLLYDELQFIPWSWQYRQTLKALAEIEKWPRTDDVEVTKRIVSAYIRHNETNYDDLYNTYNEKEKNRAIVHDRVQYIFKSRAWTWKEKTI